MVGSIRNIAGDALDVGAGQDGWSSHASKRSVTAHLVVERQTLVARILPLQSAVPITAIIGPALSGKSELLRQVAAKAPERDLTAMRVLSSTAEGIVLGSGQFLSFSELRADPRKLLFMLDDVEQVRLAAPSGEHLVRCLSRSGRVVISGRSIPFPLSAFRARGKVLDITAADLAFDEREATDFLSPTVRERGTAAFRSILRKTGGWIGGLSVARQAVLRGVDLVQADHELTGGDGLARDLFEEEVVPGLSAEELEFLRSASLFTALTPAFAERVTGNPAAGVMLRTLREKCGFLTRRPGQQIEYEFNPLFREYLETTYRETSPERWNREILDASTERLQLGDGLEAAEFAIKVGDFDRASMILGANADQAFATRGETKRFFALAQMLPPDKVSHLDRMFWVARGAAVAGSFGYAARLLQEFDTSTETTRASVSQLEVLRILVAVGFESFEDVRTRAHSFLIAKHSGSALDRAMVAAALAQASAALGDWAGHRKAIEITKAEAIAASAIYLVGWASILAAIGEAEHGRINDACAEIENCLLAPDLPGSIRRTCNLVLASLERQRGNLEKAERLLASRFRERSHHGVPDTVVLVAELRAHLELRSNGIDKAIECLADFDGWVASSFGERARRIIKIIKIEFLLRARRESNVAAAELELAQAEEWKRSRYSYPKTLDERLRLAKARLFLARGQTADALRILQPIIVQSKSAGRWAAWGQATLLRIACLFTEDRESEALRALVGVAKVLGPLGAHRVILDEAELLSPMVPLLNANAENLALSSEGSDVDRLLQDLIESASAPREKSVRVDISGLHLTKAEVNILTLVEAGRSNSEIGADLTIELPTVKWHLHNVYGKMGVRSRTAAVRRARELGILR